MKESEKGIKKQRKEETEKEKEITRKDKCVLNTNRQIPGFGIHTCSKHGTNFTTGGAGYWR
jgi:hypothetical protein